jgi:hypothetical protein
VVLKLRNVGAAAARYELVMNEVRSRCDSGYAYTEPVGGEESCVSWLEAEQWNGVLAAGEVQWVKVRMQVPEDFEGPGARACMMVESNLLERKELDRLHVGVEVRYAIHFLYRNPQVPGVVALHAQALKVEPGAALWSLQYVNAGNVDRVVHSRAQLMDESGKVVYDASSIKARGMMPNQCRTLDFPTPELPEGTYHMVVVSETDKGEQFGLTHTLDWKP